MANTPLYVSGVNLGKPVETSSGTIQDLQLGFYIDANGHLQFRDEYIVNALSKDSVSLKELYLKTKGIFYKDGKLSFKDDSLSRSYSLEEIVSSCKNWKDNLATGSLWWLGRASVDHSVCANLPRIDDLNGLNRYWSVDRFLAQLNKISSCDNISNLTFYDKTVDKNGNWLWWDIPGMEMVLPPITDQYKLAIIIAKLTFTSYNAPEPIVFRLFDVSAQQELTRISVVNSNNGAVLSPPTLSYFGNLAQTVNTCEQDEGCGCVSLNCNVGDTSCAFPDTGRVIADRLAPNSHLIKVQFHAVNYHANHWERTFGVEVDGVYTSNSTIETIIYDSNPADKFAKKHGTAAFNNANQVTITFDTPTVSTEYSVSLSASKNVNVWYTNKTTTGFVILSELPFNGYVDWTIVNINPVTGS
jgi:hypothetical protein